MSRRLEVLLHGEIVGHLSEMPDGGVEFRLLDAYRQRVPRPVLGQKFEDDLNRVHYSRKGQGLPDFFANLIPEKGRLREVIEDAAGLESGDDLALLDFVGRDLPGAVVVQALGQGELELTPQEPDLSPTLETEPSPEEGLRFSLAGVQLKFSMLLAQDKLTLPASGESGEWIVKFDSASFRQLPENEYSILKWARTAGFDVPERRLLPATAVAGLPSRYVLADSKVLAVRRYDRIEEGRRHQEDFAQVIGLPPRQKYDHVTYEAMMRLVHGLLGEGGAEEFVRRLTLVIASGNNDAHLKNWSLVYPDGIQARWSPLYDQVATVAWPEPDRKLALKLAGVKEFARVDRSTFERLAEKAELDAGRVLELVDETLQRLIEAWREISGDLPLPAGHAEALREHWRSVPLLREAGPLDRA